MGRKDRKHAEFVFLDRKIAFYRPTEGQGAAVVLASSMGGKNPGSALLRIFAVMEKLLVDHDEWESLDDALVSGEADLKDFTDLFNAILQHEWDDAQDAIEGEEAKHFDKDAELARARALLAQHGEA